MSFEWWPVRSWISTLVFVNIIPFPPLCVGPRWVLWTTREPPFSAGAANALILTRSSRKPNHGFNPTLPVPDLSAGEASTSQSIHCVPIFSSRSTYATLHKMHMSLFVSHPACPGRGRTGRLNQRDTRRKLRIIANQGRTNAAERI